METNIFSSWEQTAHSEKTRGRDRPASSLWSLSHEVFSARLFSTTHFSTVLLDTACFFVGGPTMDDDDGSSRSLVCPDITTVQAQLYLYTNENCLEIVRLPNVIASTARVVPICLSVQVVLRILGGMQWQSQTTLRFIH